jgi:formylglycine-generating enzyme required for sulfatase activity
MERSATSTGQWLGFGALALVFAVFPLAAGGKFFEETPIGETSRHCLLAGLPVAVLLVGTLRWLAQFAGGVGRRLLPAVLACAVVIFGAQYWPIYFGERVETLTSRSMLHHAVSHPDVRRASVIVNADTTATRQRIYGICSFARAFGELTRLVSPYPPRSQGGYLPSEVEWHSLCTTVLASEFNRIDPSGTHLVLQTERLRGAATDAQIAWRELHARWLGGPGERERFLASLTALRLGLLRERTPLVPAGAPSAASRPVGDFTTGAGIEMVRLPWGGWAARYETTQSQYEGVMARNPSLFPDPWRPVERVSWLEAEEFCHRLNAMESARLPAGVSYRLPTAAEFERLCGDAWAVRAVIVGLGVGSTTAGVGMYPANEWGLHDTVGNVWEWCLDWWDAAERFRVSKGGAFSSELPHLDRNAWRAEDRSFPVSRRIWLLGASAERLLGRTHRDYPDQAYWNRGFRVVLAAPPPARLPPLRASER